MSNEGKLEGNPHTWVRSSNIVFIDRPAGVGFPYAEFGEKSVPNCSRVQCSVQRHYIPLNLSSSGVPGSLGIDREGRRGTPLDILRTLLSFLEEQAPLFWWIICGRIWRHLCALYPRFSHYWSVCGRYTALFVSAVWDQNPMLVAAGSKPIEIDSVTIGELLWLLLRKAKV